MSSSPPKPKAEVAFGVKRVAGGWTVARYEIKDGKVVKEKCSEPDNRALALEKFLNEISYFWDDV